MDKNMRKYHQIKAAKVSKNKFSPNICIILNAFFRLIIVLTASVVEAENGSLITEIDISGNTKTKSSVVHRRRVQQNL